MVIVIVIALIVLGYFGFDIRKAIEAPATQDNFNYVQRVVSNVWHGYLEKPSKYLWNDIFIKLIWDPAIENLKKLGKGEPTVVDENIPQLAPPNNMSVPATSTKAGN